MHGEQQDQQDADPENRHGDADQGKNHGHVVKRGVLLGGGDDTDGCTDHRCYENRDGRKLQGVWHAVPDTGHHRFLGGIAGSHIQPQQTHEIVRVAY